MAGNLPGDARWWLVRHAQPMVEAGTCYGATDQAADPGDTLRVALRLAPLLPPGCGVWTSPLQRCRVLADALRSLRSDLAPCHADPRLAEMDFGCWEGQRWDQIPRHAFEAWTADFAGHAFGGRESLQQLMRRVDAARKEAARSSGPQLWVTHAGVMRAARLLAAGTRELATAAQWPRKAIAFGEHWRLPLP